MKTTVGVSFMLSILQMWGLRRWEVNQLFQVYTDTTEAGVQLKVPPLPNCMYDAEGHHCRKNVFVEILKSIQAL